MTYIRVDLPTDMKQDEALSLAREFVYLASGGTQGVLVSIQDAPSRWFTRRKWPSDEEIKEIFPRTEGFK